MVALDVDKIIKKLAISVLLLGKEQYSRMLCFLSVSSIYVDELYSVSVKIYLFTVIHYFLKNSTNF